MTLKDSGTRREFSTGAVRDIAEGKGRCDLLPLKIVSDVLEDDILLKIHNYTTTGAPLYLREAVSDFADVNYENLPTAILEVSKHYEAGCEKYGEHNWEKGIPLHCYIDSAVRHYLKFIRGDKDEPHDRAFLWNILGALWTVENAWDMCDLPCHKKKKE